MNLCGPCVRAAKKPFSRSCKSRVVTQKALTDLAFKELLAQHKVSYHAFLSYHRDHAKIKKATVCASGGYSNLTQALRANNWPKCGVCQGFLFSCNLSREAVQEALAGFAQADLHASHGAPQHDPEEAEVEEGAEGQLEACKKYVEKQSPKEFELIVEGTPSQPVLKYKCLICKTKTQPDGKVNFLGKPKLSSLKRYMYNHCLSYLHAQNRALRASEKDCHEAEQAERHTCNGHLVVDFSSRMFLDSLLNLNFN